MLVHLTELPGGSMQCIFAHRMVLLFGSCRRLCSMAEARSGQPRALPNARRRAACAWVAHLAPAARCTRRVRTWLNRRASTVTGLFLLSCCLGQEHVRQKESNLTLAPHTSQLCSNKKKEKRARELRLAQIAVWQMVNSCCCEFYTRASCCTAQDVPSRNMFLSLLQKLHGLQVVAV